MNKRSRDVLWIRTNAFRLLFETTHEMCYIFLRILITKYLHWCYMLALTFRLFAAVMFMGGVNENIMWAVRVGNNQKPI